MGRSGEASRRSVVAAVGRIVSRKGVEGIRVREVAAEAEVSTGAVLYHFPKNSDLLLAVHEDAVQQYLERRTTAADSPGDSGRRLVSVMRAGVPPWADEGVIRLFYEMHGLALRSEDHAALLRELWSAEHALYVRIITSGIDEGLFEVDGSVDDAASQFLALEDGLVLHLLSDSTTMDADQLVRLFAGAASVALHCPGLQDHARV